MITQKIKAMFVQHMLFKVKYSNRTGIELSIAEKESLCFFETPDDRNFLLNKTLAL
jgi:hypothetical protein